MTSIYQSPVVICSTGYDNSIFPGEVTVVLVDQFKVNVITLHRDKLWKWPTKENQSFYYMKDTVKTIKPTTEMEKCRLRVFFKFPDVNVFLECFPSF